MARTSYPRKQIFVPVNCGKLAFEDISIDEALKGLKKLGLKNVRVKKLEIKGIEAINIAESLMEDFSKTDLKMERLDLSTVRPRRTRKKAKISDANVGIAEILDKDVMELLNIDVAVPLQEALDNIISMISINQS